MTADNAYTDPVASVDGDGHLVYSDSAAVTATAAAQYWY